MGAEIYIDLGSSTVKVYRLFGKKLTRVLVKSILFKDGYTVGDGISSANKKSLFKLLSDIRDKHPFEPMQVLATAIFRKYSKPAQKKLTEEIRDRTSANLRIISQDEENKLLRSALVGKYDGEKKLMLLNIGGGSTEIVILRKGKVVETKNIDMGVGTILEAFPNINKGVDTEVLEQVKAFVRSMLPDMSNKAETAIYTGGELTYMQKLEYRLAKNMLFSDSDHSAVISFDDFAMKNKELFTSISLAKLKSLMPENKGWTIGARACSGFAEAIFEKYEVKEIIPSDSNLINGVVRTLKKN